MEPKDFYLKAFNLTFNLNKTQVKELIDCLIYTEAKRNQLVYTNGGNKRIFLLINGKIKVSELNDKGDKIIKELVLPGELFGEVFIHYPEPSYEFAEVISERAIFYILDQRQLIHLIQNNEILMMNYFTYVSEKFKNLEGRYFNMMCRDVRARLIYFFKEWARRDGKKFGGKIILKTSLTHNDLACLIGTSRQTVNEILNNLRDAGEISYNRKQLIFFESFLST